MKRFTIWLVVFAGLTVGAWKGQDSYYTENITNVTVIVDASFSMKKDWSKVNKLVEEMPQGKYTKYSLITSHGHSTPFVEDISVDNVKLYAPFSIEKVLRLEDEYTVQNANQIIFITNQNISESDIPSNWTLVKP